MKALITQSWNGYLEMFDSSHKDIYYREEYVKLYESTEGRAHCAVCYEGDFILLMTYIRKEFTGYFDFETPYGYGGPIANIDNKEWIDKALDEMELLLKNENYLCGFVRFHPLLKNSEICKGHFDVIFDRNTIAIDTSETSEKIWSEQISSKNRNMIRKAEKNGLIYKAEYDFESLQEFVKLYFLTMKRLDADDFYLFSDDYFKAFIDHFNGKAFLGTVRKDKELICAAIFMYSENYGHYHLEGSNHNFSKLGANNFLLWETAVEFHELGVKEFHLGGGYNSEPDNSLFKFKRAFSGNIKEFSIGKWIFNKEKYFEINREWKTKNPEKSVSRDAAPG